MPFTLRIREIRSLDGGTRPPKAIDGPPPPSQWDVELAAGTQSLHLRLRDPFSASPLPGNESEKAVTWYLENHISEPFETARAETAAELLSTYGRHLASQLAQNGLLPRTGDLQLHITSVARTEKSPLSAGPPLQQLHWEVLEDVKLWPPNFRLSSVSIVRSVTSLPTGDFNNTSEANKSFKILLIVSRPRPQKDVDYQLVAKCLVAIIDHVSKTNPGMKVSLKILRPPTWQAFREHLRDYDYDLVHFDMKGGVQTRPDGTTNAVLKFCRPDLADPLKMRNDFRTADEVGKELALARVRTVVLNACNSASFRDSAPGSNLAEVLLGYGVQSVLAMAYKVVEEAVEIFMNSFYQSLLAKGTSVQDAVRVARSALLSNRSRRARYMHNVQLSDYIVPVLYTSLSGPNMVEPSVSISSYLDRILTSIKQVSPVNWTTGGSASTHIPQGLLGRDYNILSLEVLLSVSRLVLVHGQGGVGKTALLRYVCEWWKSSGWIKAAAAYIDFAKDAKQAHSYRSMQDVLEAIGAQLDLASDDRSAEAILNKLRSGRYLVIFDSAEVFDTSMYLDKIICDGGLREQLKSFIDAATGNESMVIVASRLDTTTIAHVPSERHKYRLPGLSVLDSVSLLQDLALALIEELPEAFYRRENIDFLRRVVILLEGNPAAIQVIVPELQGVKFDGEALLHKVMYGVCGANKDGETHWESRFGRSITYALVLPSFLDPDKSLIRAFQFAPFWNLMPKDLNMYYWFLYLSISKYYQEGLIGNWITDEFLGIVNKCTMAQKLRTYWPKIETDLIRAGILSHATITRKDGVEIPCYHVHPLYTLVSRCIMSEENWKNARFAFVRQALLWNPGYQKRETVDWVKVEWDGAGPQHDDYLHNWKAIAMAWSVMDGNPIEEVERMGISMLDCTYQLATGVAWNNPRQARLLMPHLRAHLLQTHMIVDLIRPDGMPTRSDLYSILNYSWTLWKLEADVAQASDTTQSAIVNSALETVERWKRHSAASGTPAILQPPQEVSWFQLRHAEGAIAEHLGDFTLAKDLYARNLATDPVTTNQEMLNIIRRWHSQSLNAWAGCVGLLAVRDKTIDRQTMQDHLQNMTGFFGPKPGGMLRQLPGFLTEHADTVESMRVRDQLSFSLEREPEAVARFGKLAMGIVDGPIFGVFEDIVPRGDGEKATSVVQFFSQLLADYEKGAKGGDPEAQNLVAGMRGLESGIRMLSGDNAGAAGAVQGEIAREALSSTTSTGWEKLAELHMYMYMLAVPRAGDHPDYSKGLAHLKEWWKLHRGVGVPKRDQCYGLVKFVTCQHGLGQTADAARSVIKLVETAKTFEPADCVEGNVTAAHEWLYSEMAKFDKLCVFVDPKVVFFSSPGVAELSLKERVMMHQIMTKAKQVERDKEACEAAFRRGEEASRQLRETLKKMRDTLTSSGLPNNAGTTELVAKMDRMLAKPFKQLPKEEPDSWLF